MRGRKQRRRSRSSKGTTLVVLLVIGVLIASLPGFAASSFSMETNDRSLSANVVADQAGLMGIDTATSVTIGMTDPLVNVTNQFGTDVTVTVRLQADSTDKGELVVNGNSQGNQTSFSLSNGEMQQVDIAVVEDTNYVGEAINFEVSASAPGVVMESPNRHTTIDDGG